MKKALLIEDNLDDINFIKQAYKTFKDDFQLDVAQNYEQAFAKLEKQDYFLIVLDINLPKMNGLNILEKIKLNSKTKNIPVCILTTSKFSKDIEEAYQKGCNAYIEKPFNFKDFISTVDSLFTFWLKNCNIQSINKV